MIGCGRPRVYSDVAEVDELPPGVADDGPRLLAERPAA